MAQKMIFMDLETFNWIDLCPLCFSEDVSVSETEITCMECWNSSPIPKTEELLLSCAGYAVQDEKGNIDTGLLHGDVGKPMEKQSIIDYVGILQRYVDKGYPLFSFNGTSFDFRVLNGIIDVKELCLNHYDILFQFFRLKGYFKSLDNILEAHRLSGKLHEVTLSDGSIIKDMSGKKAPELWRLGESQAVLDYLHVDLVQPIHLINKIIAIGEIRTVAKSGNITSCRIKDLLDVRECIALPDPLMLWAKPGSDFPKVEEIIEWLK